MRSPLRAHTCKTADVLHSTLQGRSDEGVPLYVGIPLYPFIWVYPYVWVYPSIRAYRYMWVYLYTGVLHLYVGILVGIPLFGGYTPICGYTPYNPESLDYNIQVRSALHCYVLLVSIAFCLTPMPSLTLPCQAAFYLASNSYCACFPRSYRRSCIQA